MGTSIVQDVIFKVGATGAAEADKSFKGLSVGMLAGVAAAVALGAAVNKLRQHLNTLQSQYVRLDDNAKASVRQMRSATQGMVDMSTAMKISLALDTAGIKDSGNLMEAIAKAAYEQGARLGEGTDQITARMVKLTDAIAKGSVGALKEYNIDLKKSATLTGTQEAATRALIETTKDISVTYENVDDAVSSLGNAFERYISLQGPMEATSVLLSNVMGSFAKSLEEASTAIEIYITNLEQLEKMDPTGHLTSEYDKWNDVLERHQQMLADGEGVRENNLKYIEQAQDRLDGLADSAKSVNDAFEDTIKVQDEMLAAGVFDSFAFMMQSSEEFGTTVETGGVSTPKAVKKPRGGKAPKMDTMDFTLEDLEDDLLARDISESREVDAGFDTDIYEAELMELMEIIEAPGIAREAERVKLAEQQVVDSELAAEVRATEINNLITQEALKYGITEESLSGIYALEANYANKEMELTKLVIRTRAGQYQEFFGNLALLQNVESRKAFNIGKVAAISEATIQGALGAVKAFQAMASIPYVGPVLGAVAAASVLTYTGVQVKKIGSQKFDSAGAGSGAGSVAAPSLSGGSSSLGEGDYGRSTDNEGGGVIENTIYLDGAVLHQSVMDTNDNASQQGQRSLGATT